MRGAHHIVPSGRLSSPCQEAFACSTGVKQRLNGRLSQVHTGSPNAEVHPVLQPMVVGGHGRATRCRFVGEPRGAYAELDLGQSSAERFLVCGVVCGVGAVHHHGRHAACVHVLNKLGKRGVVSCEQAVSAVFHSCAVRTQRSVDGGRHQLGVHVVRAGHNQSCRACTFEVVRCGRHGSSHAPVQFRCRTLTGDGCVKCCQHLAVFRRLDHGARVGVGAGQAHHGFKCMELGHRPVFRTTCLHPL